MLKIQALYSRVSTDMQRDKGFSVPRQKEWLEQEAKRHGLIHLQHFVDDGYSAASTNRPAFKSLLSKIEEGLIEAVIVYKFDRLARNVQDLLAFVDLLNKHGVKFISISENLDTTTPTGRLMLTVLGSLAEWERSITVARVKDAMYDKANKGDFCGGQPPYGYDVKDKHLVMNEIEAKIVRKIFNYFEEFRSIRKVVIWLNDKGYLTKRGQSWPTATVKRILSSLVYTGYYTYGKRAGGSKFYLPQDKWLIIKGDFKPIISKEQFNRVQALIRQRQFNNPNRYGTLYLLSGLLRCEECGGAICGHTNRKPSGKTYGTYRCHYHLSKGDKICSGVIVKKAKLEQDVLEEVKKVAHLYFEESEADEVLAKDGESDHPEDLKTIETTINRLKAKQQKLLMLFEEDSIGKDLIVERMSKLTEELDRLQIQRGNLVIEMNPKEKNKRIALLQKIRDLNDDLFNQPDTVKRTILKQLIKKVVVGKNEKLEIEMYEL